MDWAQGLSASRGGRSQRRTAAGRSSGAAVVVLALLSQLVVAAVVLVLSYWQGVALRALRGDRRRAGVWIYPQADGAIAAGARSQPQAGGGNNA